MPTVEATDTLPAAEFAGLDERICQFLVTKGRLKEADLGRARRLYEEGEDGNFVPLLTRLGLVSEREMAEALTELLDLPLLTAKDFPESPPANAQVSVRFLKQQRADLVVMRRCKCNHTHKILLGRR